ncbi:MAG: PilZ domain-containing protein [Myxococcaceae bacterium]|nr:PilZ domain-containing protein [Myxococcaceae bacterium]
MNPIEKFWSAPKELKRPLDAALTALAERGLAELATEVDAAATVVNAAPVRRAAQRTKMSASIDMASDSNFYGGFSTDISTGGVFVATVYALPVGAEVDLSFTLPSGEKIEVHGAVRWTREVNDKIPDSFPGVGIQFINLNERDRKAIERFVASREPMFFPD